MSLHLGELGVYGPLLGGIALHGVVDCLTLTRVLCYLPALIPVEGLTLKTGFFVASVVHIASDVSVVISTLVHLVIAMFALLEAREGATAVMVSYMWMVHMPIMLYRAAVAGELLSFAVISISIVAGTCHSTALLRRLHMLEHDEEDAKTLHIVLPPLVQRVVVCHVVAKLVADAARLPL